MPIIHHKSLRYQRGISLFVVIVLVMLSMLLALWGARTSLFSEMIVGNDADYQRTFEAAQALIQDAEFDIRTEQSDGTPCIPSGQVCRAAGAIVWIPAELKDLGEITATLDASSSLGGSSNKCINGLCLKFTDKQDFWNDKTVLTAMMDKNVGARYGQFTGAKTGSYSNPILKYNDPSNDKDKGGWYWIEILPYVPDETTKDLVTNGMDFLKLTINPKIVYRITAVAHGRKPGTRVVLQSTYVRQKMKD
jgi:type IV pilus assembly protein PilX